MSDLRRPRRPQPTSYDSGPRFAGNPLHLSTTRPAEAPVSETFRSTHNSRFSGSFAPESNRLQDGQEPSITIQSRFGMPRIGKAQ